MRRNYRKPHMLALVFTGIAVTASVPNAFAQCERGISAVGGERHGDTIYLESVITRPDHFKRLRTWKAKINIAPRCLKDLEQSRTMLKIKSTSHPSRLIPIESNRKRNGRKRSLMYQLTTDRALNVPTTMVTELVLLSGDKEIDRVRIVREQVMNWSSGFRLGVQYEGYSPNGARSAPALWHGPSVQFFLGSWIDQRNRRRPSHGQVYWKTSLLSREEGGELTLVYGFGTQVSFEPDARRRWLIPTFGIDIGGLYGLNRDKRAHSFQLSPQVGVLLYTSPRFTISSRMGYILPMVSALETHRGFIGSVGASVDIW